MDDYHTISAKMRAATSLEEFHQLSVMLVRCLKQESDQRKGLTP